MKTELVTVNINFFLLKAKFVAAQSLKKNTKVGVVIVGNNNSIVMTACNGFLDGVARMPEREEAPLKSKFSEHAERKAIYEACRLGISLEGCTMYATHFPCSNCARGIILVGIKEVIIDDAALIGEFASRWHDDFISAKELLVESGVRITLHKLKIH